MTSSAIPSFTIFSLKRCSPSIGIFATNSYNAPIGGECSITALPVSGFTFCLVLCNWSGLVAWVLVFPYSLERGWAVVDALVFLTLRPKMNLVYVKANEIGKDDPVMKQKAERRKAMAGFILNILQDADSLLGVIGYLCTVWSLAKTHKNL